MNVFKLWIPVLMPVVAAAFSSCSPQLSGEKLAQVATFRVAPVRADKMVTTLPSGGEDQTIVGGPDQSRLQVGMLNQLAEELGKSQFRKNHGANTAIIEKNLPKDLVSLTSRKIQGRLASTGRVVKTGGGLLRIDIEKSGVMIPPSRILFSERKVTPYIIASVTLESSSGEVLSKDKIIGFGAFSGYSPLASETQRMLGSGFSSRRIYLPQATGHEGKTIGTYAANPSILRRDYEAAADALAEDLVVLLNELSGKKASIANRR